MRKGESRSEGEIGRKDSDSLTADVDVSGRVVRRYCYLTITWVATRNRNGASVTVTIAAASLVN